MKTSEREGGGLYGQVTAESVSPPENKMRVRRLTAVDPPTFTLLMRKNNYYLLYASYAAFVYDLGNAFFVRNDRFFAWDSRTHRA